MNKTSSIWMAVLTFSAVILGAILLSNNERPAQAAMLNAQPNMTLMTTGNGADEGLVVVDKTQQKMAVYLLRGNDLAYIAGMNLGR